MSHHLCPVCGSSLRQSHRRSVDRLISKFYRVHRYRCSNAECRWEGLLHSKRQKAKKRKPQWWPWVLIVLLGVAIGVALFEYFSTPPKISTDVTTSP
jgi:hypothetical protein